MVVRLPVSNAVIEEFCRRHRIRRLALFGSAVHDEMTPTSDLDILVEFEPGHTPGLSFLAVQRELSTLLGRNVDLNTANDLSPYFREEVFAEAEELYATA